MLLPRPRYHITITIIPNQLVCYMDLRGCVDPAANLKRVLRNFENNCKALDKISDQLDNPHLPDSKRDSIRPRWLVLLNKHLDLLADLRCAYELMDQPPMEKK